MASQKFPGVEADRRLRMKELHPEPIVEEFEPPPQPPKITPGR